MTSSSKKVFIDGQVGTTGLQIFERLKAHDAVEVISIDPEDRKDNEKKKLLMKEADITFFCLPDDPAREAAVLAKEAGCRVIDASTAHRCHPDWVYGLPELNKQQRSKIKEAAFVANPGCYATGAILLAAPLINEGVLSADETLHIMGVSGYSGGGTALIADYEEAENPSAYAIYGLDLSHKHLPEVQLWAGLKARPTFVPSVANLKQGMFVYFCVDQKSLNKPVSSLSEVYRKAYDSEETVRFDETSLNFEGRFKYIEGLENTNTCLISTFLSADQSQAILVAQLDNLGKGASGAAVQNMNIMLGLPEHLGNQPAKR